MGQVVNGIVLEKGLRADFMKAYAAQEQSLVMQAAMKVDSSADTEKFGWLGAAPTMQEWADEKVPKGLLDFDYSIKNKPYEATLGVDKFTLRNDQLGAIKVRINDLASRAKLFPVKLLLTLIVAGTSGLCYDGQAFFSASHSEGSSGTQSNLVTGTGVTVAAVMADFTSARAKMWSFLDDQGEPFFEGDLKLLIVAPPGLQGVMEQMLNASYISQTENVLKGAAQLHIASRLASSDANDWYLFEIGGAIKPLILQENMPVTFGALEQNSESGFLRKHYYYGVEWYGNVGYGLWQKAVKVTNT